VNELIDSVDTIFVTPLIAEALAFTDSQFQRADEQLQRMRIEEESLLAGRIELSEAEYRRMLTFFRTCFGFAALVLLWSSFDILRQTARTARAEKLVTSLNVRLQNVHDEEGKRIGRDLHDSVGQLLAAARLAVARIEATKDLPENVREHAQLATEATEEAMREIRTISYLLHPPMLDELGFVAAAQWFVRGFSERSGIAVNLDLPDDSLKLRPEVALALFRALQVGLSNVHRHSGSKSADVGLTRGADDVCLEISDSGAGMPPDRLELVQRLPAAAGVGLGGLKERVSQLQGDLEITSDGHGTCLRVRLPTTTTN
jgi:signal transduction histidine kinase